MKSGPRVLFVWGSETRVTEGFVNDLIAKEWKAKHGNDALQLEIVNGDDMSERWDDVSPENYDYLLVATSSYAEGDPPSGFGRFLYRLQETSREWDGNANDIKPLYGIQHAVLGVGNTQYDTFQNIPRHVDKYLGECGSRRCKQRFEWDEMENSQKDVLNWSQEMIDIILKDAEGTNKTEPEVCSWEEPSSELYDKVVGEDGWEDTGRSRTQAEISPLMMILGFILIIAGAFYNKEVS
jgi:sulfite reductase alpha subunit-like flavoprotein